MEEKKELNLIGELVVVTPSNPPLELDWIYVLRREIPQLEDLGIYNVVLLPKQQDIVRME